LTFDADLGVTYASSVGGSSFAGLPLQRVSTGSEGLGKYSIGSTTPGLYNFSFTETTVAAIPVPVKITYTQSGSTTSSTLNQTSLTVTNQPIGFTPTFQLDYYTALSQPTAQPFGVRVYSAVAAKHMMAFKLEDFMLPEFDFDIFANNVGQVYTIVLPSIS
jgi:hypothetical protein